MNLAEDEGLLRIAGRKRLVGVFRGRESISAGYSTEPQAMNGRTFRHSSPTPGWHDNFFSEKAMFRMFSRQGEAGRIFQRLAKRSETVGRKDS
jgi:hypothetical protein